MTQKNSLGAIAYVCMNREHHDAGAWYHQAWLELLLEGSLCLSLTNHSLIASIFNPLPPSTSPSAPDQTPNLGGGQSCCPNLRNSALTWRHLKHFLKHQRNITSNVWQLVLIFPWCFIIIFFFSRFYFMTWLFLFKDLLLLDIFALFIGSLMTVVVKAASQRSFLLLLLPCACYSALFTVLTCHFLVLYQCLIVSTFFLSSSPPPGNHCTSVLPTMVQIQNKWIKMHVCILLKRQWLKTEGKRKHVSFLNNWNENTFESLLWC